MQMEERLRQAELRLKGAQQEVATLRANAQDVAGVRREVALLEQELSQVCISDEHRVVLSPYQLGRQTVGHFHCAARAVLIVCLQDRGCGKQ